MPPDRDLVVQQLHVDARLLHHLDRHVVGHALRRVQHRRLLDGRERALAEVLRECVRVLKGAAAVRDERVVALDKLVEAQLPGPGSCRCA